MAFGQMVIWSNVHTPFKYERSLEFYREILFLTKRLKIFEDIKRARLLIKDLNLALP